MYPTFETAFHKILKAIVDICDRTCNNKVLFYMANILLDLISPSVCVVDIVIFVR